MALYAWLIDSEITPNHKVQWSAGKGDWKLFTTSDSLLSCFTDNARQQT